jgi:hypothetical protein
MSANATISFDGQRATISVDAAVIYNVELGEECPTGGDIKVGYIARARGGGQSESISARARAVFGAGCQVTVYARAD